MEQKGNIFHTLRLKSFTYGFDLNAYTISYTKSHTQNLIHKISYTQSHTQNVYDFDSRYKAVCYPHVAYMLYMSILKLLK